MTKSDLLRVQDVRDAYRLIGECRDLGSEPALWHRRMLEGLCRLVGGRAATGGGARWIRPHGEIHAVFAVDVGLGSRGHDLYMAYMRELNKPPTADEPGYLNAGKMRFTRRLKNVFAPPRSWSPLAMTGSPRQKPEMTMNTVTARWPATSE